MKAMIAGGKSALIANSRPAEVDIPRAGAPKPRVEWRAGVTVKGVPQ